jgi:hypothetical protein
MQRALCSACINFLRCTSDRLRCCREHGLASMPANDNRMLALQQVYNKVIARLCARCPLGSTAASQAFQLCYWNFVPPTMANHTPCPGAAIVLDE